MSDEPILEVKELEVISNLNERKIHNDLKEQSNTSRTKKLR